MSPQTPTLSSKSNFTKLSFFILGYPSAANMESHMGSITNGGQSSKFDVNLLHDYENKTASSDFFTDFFLKKSSFLCGCKSDNMMTMMGRMTAKINLTNSQLLWFCSRGGGGGVQYWLPILTHHPRPPTLSSIILKLAHPL